MMHALPSVTVSPELQVEVGEKCTAKKAQGTSRVSPGGQLASLRPDFWDVVGEPDFVCDSGEQGWVLFF